MEKRETNYTEHIAIEQKDRQIERFRVDQHLSSTQV